MVKIEQVPEGTMADNPSALCLTKFGWVLAREKVRLEPRGMPLQEALESLWNQHQSLLGEGDLVFKVLANHGKDGATGYILFEPCQTTNDL